MTTQSRAAKAAGLRHARSSKYISPCVRHPAAFAARLLWSAFADRSVFFFAVQLRHQRGFFAFAKPIRYLT